MGALLPRPSSLILFQTFQWTSVASLLALTLLEYQWVIWSGMCPAGRSCKNIGAKPFPWLLKTDTASCVCGPGSSWSPVLGAHAVMQADLHGAAVHPVLLPLARNRSKNSWESKGWKEFIAKVRLTPQANSTPNPLPNPTALAHQHVHVMDTHTQQMHKNVHCCYLVFLPLRGTTRAFGHQDIIS